MAYKLFIGSLSWNTDDAALEAAFAPHGKIVSATVVRDRDSGRSKGFGFVEQKLSAMRTYCGANTMPLFVIDSHANVLKCWCNLGRSEKNKIGSINEEGEFIISNFNALARWMSMDPFTNSICLECSVLPICMGGCIYYQVADNYDSFEDGCSHLRYNLESILKLLYISKTKTAEQLKNINLTNIGGYYEHA